MLIMQAIGWFLLAVGVGAIFMTIFFPWKGDDADNS
jgi:hypothetical protein